MGRGVRNRLILWMALALLVGCGSSAADAEGAENGAASSGDETSTCEGASACDRDADGVFDSVDECPDDSEDIDGYLDNDGCPEADREIDRTVPVAPK